MEKEHREAVKAYRQKALGAKSVTVELSTPIKVNGLETRSITLRRPTVGDLRRANAMPGTDNDKEVALTAALAEMSPEDLDQIDVADFDCVEAVVLGFRRQRVAR